MKDDEDIFVESGIFRYNGLLGKFWKSKSGFVSED